jgi:hypothetical protein
MWGTPSTPQHTSTLSFVERQYSTNPQVPEGLTDSKQSVKGPHPDRRTIMAKHVFGDSPFGAPYRDQLRKLVRYTEGTSKIGEGAKRIDRHQTDGGGRSGRAVGPPARGHFRTARGCHPIRLVRVPPTPTYGVKVPAEYRRAITKTCGCTT